MDPKNDAQAEVDVAATEVETLEEATEDVQDTTDWKAKHDEVVGRLKRAETKLEKSKIEKKAEQLVEKQNTGDLDETQLLFLEIKGGVNTDNLDEMKLVDEWTANGKTVKQLATNRIFQAELKAIKDAAAVKDATPSTSKRSGNTQTNDIAIAIAKYEQTGQLPDDFKLRSAVVNAKVDKENTNKPTWH